MTFDAVRPAVERVRDTGYRTSPEASRGLPAWLRDDRLTEFQDYLPKVFALEMIESYPLDVAGASRWLEAGP